VSKIIASAFASRIVKQPGQISDSIAMNPDFPFCYTVLSTQHFLCMVWPRSLCSVVGFFGLRHVSCDHEKTHNTPCAHTHVITTQLGHIVQGQADERSFAENTHALLRRKLPEQSINQHHCTATSRPNVNCDRSLESNLGDNFSNWLKHLYRFQEPPTLF